MNNLTDLDISTILKEKPYILDTAIEYAEDLSRRYKKLYCVVRAMTKSKKIRKYDIIGFKHFRDNIPQYELYYITSFKGEKV